MVFLLIAGMSLWARSAQAELVKMDWKIDGVEREAMVSLPASGGEKAPIIFFFHGHGGNMNGTSKNVALHKLWPEAIVVYPQGLPTESKLDPNGKKPGWQHDPGESNDRDLKLFDAILTTMEEKHGGDPKRVYSSGFSNGAFFTYLLWSQRGKKLAAVAPCSGLIWPGTHPSPARPALIVSGEKDPKVKIEKAKETIAEVRKLNDCAEEGKPWLFEGTVLYASSKHIPLVTYIHSGGHELPQPAHEMIVKFFKLHKLSD